MPSSDTCPQLFQQPEILDFGKSLFIALRRTLSRTLLYFSAATAKSLQLCLTLCDPRHGSPPRLLRPWDSPGKNTRVGCHFLLQFL